MKSKHKILLILFGVLMCLGFTFSVHAEDSVLCETGPLYVDSNDDKAKTKTDVIPDTPETPKDQKKSDLSDLQEATEKKDVPKDAEVKNAQESEPVLSDDASGAKDTIKTDKSGEITEQIENENTGEKSQKKSTSDDVSSEKSEGEQPEQSNYTVEFTHKDLQYVLGGNKSVKLSKILDKVKIEGKNVENVECSNPDLFSASKRAENGLFRRIKRSTPTNG
ncbi:MAG: hypothetical protein IKE05_05490 [Clostridia bacterium]|nr:hypothetical protein [Clostridia bacterium]